MNASRTTERADAALIHPTPNEYVGKHRATVRTVRTYGPVPVVPAGVGVSLGVEPHLTLTDMTGATVRILLSPEDVEHIEVGVAARRAIAEARRAEDEL